MKTDLNPYGPQLQTAKRTSGAAPLVVPKKETLAPKTEVKPPSPDYKLDLSSPGLPPAVSLPEAPKPKISTPKEVKDLPKIEVKNGTVKKPAVIFIKGMDMFSSPSKSERGYAGVGKMAESIEGSRIYGWDQQDEIIEHIKKVHPDFPVVLVGHSLGGDTAVEVADALDSLEHDYRKVDLLVTIDAVGFSHDIIGQNVKKHLNVFGENDFFFNDGPHVARREEKTAVRNILSPLDHTQLDDDREVQFEVVSLIKESLGAKA